MHTPPLQSHISGTRRLTAVEGAAPPRGPGNLSTVNEQLRYELYEVGCHKPRRSQHGIPSCKAPWRSRPKPRITAPDFNPNQGGSETVGDDAIAALDLPRQRSNPVSKGQR